MAEWGFGFSFDMELEEPLDFFNVGYKNGEKVRYDKRPHGEWIDINNTHTGSEIHVCSECKKKRVLIDTPYCPWCGAEMKEDKE